MRNGKGLEFPEGWGGGKGEPGVPPTLYGIYRKIFTRTITLRMIQLH
jgi:hypothetical protein